MRNAGESAYLLFRSLQGAVSTFYEAAVIAAAAFQKACSLVEVDPASYTEQLQDVSSWYDVFDVDREEVEGASAVCSRLICTADRGRFHRVRGYARY